jgi:2-(1,2-epoxy-1,2-dihydrophenyl)acetyl-CoA isomerase
MHTIFTIQDRGAVRRLTLTRPDRKNAIPPEGWALLTAAFLDFEQSAQRVLVVTGEGGDFCAGADLAAADRPGAGSVDDNVAGMDAVGGAALALHQVTKPTVAAVDGVAVGAGMNLALGCDIVIATDRARFAEIFVRRGLTLDFGGTWLLPRLIGLAKARELALTGRIIDAAEAEAIGLVAAVVGGDDLDAAVESVVAELLAASPLGQRAVKAGLSRSFAMTFEEAIAFESEHQAALLLSSDVKEAVAAFLEKRLPRFEGR